MPALVHSNVLRFLWSQVNISKRITLLPCMAELLCVDGRGQMGAALVKYLPILAT